MIAERIPQIQELTLEEKLALSDELWLEATEMTPSEVDSELVDKLNDRYEEFEKDSSLGVSSEEMKKRFHRKRNG